jgi:hypothetical protein
LKKINNGLYYIRVKISFQGNNSGIEIKRSVIEGKKLDEKDAERVGNILNQLMESYNRFVFILSGRLFYVSGS